ncbi:hypothetical protein C6A77_17025 [Pseudomonas sp. AFG_SD02_1510_Pfu_092]|uniref:hypothetical protein n=1 Tax=Pseudomonas sp. AFG_SD02_1510_Pfu_092 TaxID=2259497 RepID=UPI000DEFA141|nr:hypothetical protein [Pseudomonas sp. AFG_SD02_1510_Pfu_092]RCL24151.1 hypothetical protein C6A77_17025 [Pseudomonas sp. AFG_SD02_1510_Pfu_092]
MSRGQELQQFLSRYFGVFLVEFFLSCLAIGGCVSLVFSTWLRSPERGLSMLALALAWAVSAASHIAMVRGYAWGVRGVIGINGLAVLAVLPSYAYRPHMGAFVSVLVFGLLALLVINSQRYREMRVRLAGYRDIRRANRQAAKAGK